MDVVEDDDERPGLGGLPQEGAHRLEEAEAGALAVQRRDLASGNELGEVTVVQIAPQRLDPRPVRRGAARLPAAPDQDLRLAPPRPGGELLDKPALADAGLARDEQDAPATAEGGAQGVVEGRELARSAHEHPAGRCSLGHLNESGDVELLVLAEDRLVQIAQRAPRLDPELLDQRRARRLVGGEHVGLTSGAIEGEHELSAQALA